MGAGSFGGMVGQFTQRGFGVFVNEGIRERKVRVGICRLVWISGCRVRVRGFGAAVDEERGLSSFDIEDDDVEVSADDAIGASRFRK